MTVRHVELPETAAVVRALLRQNDVDAGTLVVQARPDIRRVTTLVHDLLAAMGKRPDVKGVERSTADDVRYLQVWMQAHAVQRVVVVEANWARPGIMTELAQTLRPTDVDLWLADRLPTSDHHEDVLLELGSFAAPATALPLGEQTQLRAATSFPAVPDDDAASFRWSCREVLAPPDFRRGGCAVCQRDGCRPRSDGRDRARPRDDRGLPTTAPSRRAWSG